ncbi:DUF3951 domain-containing protein [Bacillus sp. CGMCC 1.16607]|uniref:DUF3951 domain-containing protein n=1 Tax=Bacillus sp. CGMCC 1.16607 TaxID=3351842 RepID=UPI0036455AEC
MNLIDSVIIGFLTIYLIVVIIGFYKVFVKKKSPALFYTPFDNITGQSEVEFHEEQEILAEDEGQGDDKNKSKKYR